MLGVPRFNETVLLGGGIATVGLILSVVHLSHAFAEREVIPLLIGGLIPLVLSVALVGFGLWIAVSRWPTPTTRRVTVWLAFGMGWMMVAGAGSIIYETVEGTALTHARFLLPVFGTYGAIPGLITGLYDSQRQRRARALETQELALESATDGMAILDTDRTYVFVNDAHAQIYGYDDPDALVGQSWKSLYEDDEIERFEAEIMPELFEAGSWRGRATGRRRDGSTFPQRVTLTELEDGGFICIVRDISDTVDRELAFSVLNRVLRHNLSNDINVVIGHAERIRSMTTGELASAAARIEETGSALAGLAEKERQIADLVLRDPVAQPMDLDSLVEHAVGTVSQRHPHATIETDGRTGQPVLAIPELELGLVELLENGIIHAETDDPRVEVTVEHQGSTIHLAISDEGPGIPEQDRMVVSGKQEIDALFHGSGLGLWYVYWVMRNMGGQITFADRDPVGSVVHLTIPAG